MKRAVALAALALVSRGSAPGGGREVEVVAYAADPPASSIEANPSPYSFLQLASGIRISGRRLDAPEVIFLPANQLAELPWPAYRTRAEERVEVRPGVPPAECATPECRSWVERSLQRRARLAELVSRRYVLRNGRYRETLASAAARQLGGAEAGLLPRAEPSIRLTGEEFAVLVPWEAVPPQSELRMEFVSVVLENGERRRHPLRVRLGRPRLSTCSPCDLPLIVPVERGRHPHRSWQPGFYLPQADLGVSTVFAWEDPSGVYGVSQPAPLLFSAPITYAQLGPDEWMCGPILKYRRGADAATQRNSRVADAHGFETARLDAAETGRAGYLVLERPRKHSYSVNGGGMCGAETAVSWAIYHVSLEGQIREVAGMHSLRMRCARSEPWDYEVEISRDLRTVTEYMGSSREDEYPRGLASLIWRSRRSEWRDGKFVTSAWQRSRHVPGSSAQTRNELWWR